MPERDPTAEAYEALTCVQERCNEQLNEIRDLKAGNALLAALGDDERMVLRFIASRLAKGAGVYGKLDLLNDKRDWLLELSEELADALVYLAAWVLSRVLKGRKIQ